MNGWSFAIDWRAFGIAAVFCIAYYYFQQISRKFPSPRLFFSNLRDFEPQNPVLKARYSFLPKYLEYAALAAFLLGFIDPKIFVPKPIMPGANTPSEATEGIGIYFLLDQSGSMADSITITLPGQRLVSLPKEQILKELTTDFIKGNSEMGLGGRPNDMIGLVTFARIPQVIAPLTLDHKAILDDLKKVEVVKDKTWDGTDIGYAIYKTAHLIAATKHYAQELAGAGKPAYDIKNTIIILVTDGLQESNPLDAGNPLRTMDIPEGAAYAKEQGVRVYIVNLEPKLITEEFAPFRHQMQEATESTGGKLFMIDSSTNLVQIYADIDQLEKSKLPWQEELMSQIASQLPKDKLPDLFHRISFYPYFIALGILFLFLSIFLNTTVMRKVP